MRKMPFSFEIEKLLPLEVLVRQSYVNDKEKFIVFSPKYKDGHLEELDKRAKLVDDCINPKSLTVRMKNNTGSQVKLFDRTLAFLDKVERYVEMAETNVPLTKKDLGITPLREECHSHNAAFVTEGLKTIKKLLAPHLAILEPLGYTKEIQAEGESLTTTIGSNKIEYNKLLNERMKLVVDNIDLFESLWDFLNDILKTGKTIYKKDPVKIKEYTQSEILKRLEHIVSDDNDETGGTTTDTKK